MNKVWKMTSEGRLEWTEYVNVFGAGVIVLGSHGLQLGPMFLVRRTWLEKLLRGKNKPLLFRADIGGLSCVIGKKRFWEETERLALLLALLLALAGICGLLVWLILWGLRNYNHLTHLVLVGLFFYFVGRFRS